MLKNRDALARQQEIELEELLAANRPLFVTCLMRDALKDVVLLRYRHRRPRLSPPGTVKRCAAVWSHYGASPSACGLTCTAFSPTPLGPLGTNAIEGINNKIKVIKRMAYGFRDDAYFLLLPQDPGGLSRNWVKNHEKAPPVSGGGFLRS